MKTVLRVFLLFSFFRCLASGENVSSLSGEGFSDKKNTIKQLLIHIGSVPQNLENFIKNVREGTNESINFGLLENVFSKDEILKEYEIYKKSYSNIDEFWTAKNNLIGVHYRNVIQDNSNVLKNANILPQIQEYFEKSLNLLSASIYELQYGYFKEYKDFHIPFAPTNYFTKKHKVEYQKSDKIVNNLICQKNIIQAQSQDKTLTFAQAYFFANKNSGFDLYSQAFESFIEKDLPYCFDKDVYDQFDKKLKENLIKTNYNHYKNNYNDVFFIEPFLLGYIIQCNTLNKCNNQKDTKSFNLMKYESVYNKTIDNNIKNDSGINNVKEYKKYNIKNLCNPNKDLKQQTPISLEQYQITGITNSNSGNGKSYTLELMLKNQINEFHLKPGIRFCEDSSYEKISSDEKYSSLICPINTFFGNENQNKSIALSITSQIGSKSGYSTGNLELMIPLYINHLAEVSKDKKIYIYCDEYMGNWNVEQTKDNIILPERVTQVWSSLEKNSNINFIFNSNNRYVHKDVDFNISEGDQKEGYFDKDSRFKKWNIYQIEKDKLGKRMFLDYTYNRMIPRMTEKVNRINIREINSRVRQGHLTMDQDGEYKDILKNMEQSFSIIDKLLFNIKDWNNKN